MAQEVKITVFDPKPRKAFHLRGIYKPLYFFEELFKRAIFDCRSCGQCILSTTGFVCPMRCPKTLRNGACGGSKDGMCEVNNTKKCVWNEIYEGGHSLNREDMLYKFQPPIDHLLQDTSAVVNWLDHRIEGMHLALPGKGNAFVQLIKMAIHIIVIRFRKFIHAPRYWQKQESHYEGA
ncbi:MAG: methylenetetrahydrofolate reductase C-terminal domain-containing protein [Actinobacteria bacterium]|nr:methylenetetrahydrofolate reductase C-terminal domain-containing protein [Actinomycetota bacterium]